MKRPPQATTIPARARSDLEIKRANIRHHDVEAIIFDGVHPEGSSIYEISEIKKNLKTIVNKNNERELCIDIGCGTGFLTDYELPLYTYVIALDISSNMIKTIRKKLSFSDCLNLIQGDAENLPIRQEVADLISISSVLHHVPKPFNAISEISRVLKKGGCIYITREPNQTKVRRIFTFIDQHIIKKIALLVNKNNTRIYSENDILKYGLDYNTADVHLPTGLNIVDITAILTSKSFQIITAYSYHWLFSDYKLKSTRDFISKINYFIKKIPCAHSLGRYINIIAQKRDNKFSRARAQVPPLIQSN